VAVTVRLEVVPMSVNRAWKGQRYKTDEYKRYENSLLWLLPKITLPEPPYQVNYRFGMSNIVSDWDNPVKPLQDIIQKKYGFNDRFIMRAIVEKVKTDKGKEFIEFQIIHYG
jgi:Holliday junction resolvase RusA-like endonuclease